MASPFYNVGGVRPPYSAFSLSHKVKATLEMGYLFPSLVEDCIPGDVWNISNRWLLRFHQSLFAPLVHDVEVSIQYFFVPYRILWHSNRMWFASEEEAQSSLSITPGNNPSGSVPTGGVLSRVSYDGEENPESVFPHSLGSWEQFLTGGVDGRIVLSLPRLLYGAGSPTGTWLHHAQLPGDILDWLYGVSSYGMVDDDTSVGHIVLDASESPLSFPLFAYSFIYNQYYRDQNLWLPAPPSQVNPGTDVGGTETIHRRYIRRRCWEKDYFTSALPWRQRGTTPSLPINISGTVLPLGDARFSASGSLTPGSLAGVYGSGVAGSDFAGFAAMGTNISNVATNLNSFMNQSLSFEGDPSALQITATTFSVNDLRQAVQTQLWLERNMRCGIRYGEFLMAHYNTCPRDERLQVPEYLGQIKGPIVFNEVLQTSESTSTSPQGQLAGHGISVNGGHAIKYHVKEHGLIMGILSVMPSTSYQDGFERMWLRDSRTDFYFPEFEHLGERSVWNQEILARNTSDSWNRGVFGYQPMYDEYRYRKSKVHGELKTSLDHWHLGRQFGSYAPAAESTSPMLNRQFVECRPRRDIYPAPSQDGMLIDLSNSIRVARPMSPISDPGYLDHPVYH